MIPASLREFFAASAGVAGALIGLLFVAVTVAAGRLTRPQREGQLHRIRASAALTAFTNALVVSLLALVPGQATGPTAVAMAGGGLMFVMASLLSLIRLRQVHWRTTRDALFLAGLVIIFTAQLTQGIELIIHPGDSGAPVTIAVLVAACFLIGIDRAWELVGGPAIGISQEVAALVRGHDHDADDPTSTQLQPQLAEDWPFRWPGNPRVTMYERSPQARQVWAWNH